MLRRTSRFLIGGSLPPLAFVSMLGSGCSSRSEMGFCSTITASAKGVLVPDCLNASMLSDIMYDASGNRVSYAFVVSCLGRAAHGIWDAQSGLQCVDGVCEAGACTPNSDVDCRTRPNCDLWGECGYSDGGTCVLTDDGCAHSEVSCGQWGECHLSPDGTTCVVLSDTDCSAPGFICPQCSFQGACSTFGNCVAVNGQCVAQRDSDCKGAQQCAFAGKCTLQGNTCVAATDADCASAEVCMVDGQCDAVAGQCTVR